MQLFFAITQHPQCGQRASCQPGKKQFCPLKPPHPRPISRPHRHCSEKGDPVQTSHCISGHGDAGNLSLAIFIHLDLQLNRFIFYQMFSISITTTAFCPTFDSISGWLMYQITQYRCCGRGISHPGLFQNACYPATKRRAVFLSLATATQAGTPSLRNAWVHQSLQENHRSEHHLRGEAQAISLLIRESV